jgi:SWIM/SEC-C metal-binding protein
MSKFFFKGRIEKKPKHESFGFNTKRETKLGSETNPLMLSVKNEARHQEVLLLVNENKLFAKITVNAEADENIAELKGVLNKPKTTVFDKKPNRNDPCLCGSNKKYKQCCG